MDRRGDRAVNVLNYAQLVICGLRLDKTTFGTLASLLASIALCTVFANSVQINVTREVASAPISRSSAICNASPGERCAGS